MDKTTTFDWFYFVCLVSKRPVWFVMLNRVILQKCWVVAEAGQKIHAKLMANILLINNSGNNSSLRANACQPTAGCMSNCLQIDHPATLSVTGGQHVESPSRKYPFKIRNTECKQNEMNYGKLIAVLSVVIGC